MATIFYDALLECLPDVLKSCAIRLTYDDSSRVILDDILRFALTGRQSARAAKYMTCTPVDWICAQKRWKPKRDALLSGPDDNETTDATGQVAFIDTKEARLKFSEDKPVFKLDRVSCTSPRNGKYTITIGTTAISLTDAEYHWGNVHDGLAAAILAFKYAFVLPEPDAKIVLIGEKTEGRTTYSDQIVFEPDFFLSHKNPPYSQTGTLTHREYPTSRELLLSFSPTSPPISSSLTNLVPPATPSIPLTGGHGVQNPWIRMSAAEFTFSRKGSYGVMIERDTLHVIQASPNYPEIETAELRMLCRRLDIQEWILDAEPRFRPVAVPAVSFWDHKEPDYVLLTKDAEASSKPNDDETSRGGTEEDEGKRPDDHKRSDAAEEHNEASEAAQSTSQPDASKATVDTAAKMVRYTLTDACWGDPMEEDELDDDD